MEGRVRAGEAREAARRLLEQQLQSQFPNARQCGRCGAGPVDHAACYDLEAHQGWRAARERSRIKQRVSAVRVVLARRERLAQVGRAAAPRGGEQGQTPQTSSSATKLVAKE